MSELEILQKLSALVPWGPTALAVLGSLVVVAQVVVLITPTKKDDDLLNGPGFLGKLLQALKSFAPWQK